MITRINKLMAIMLITLMLFACSFGTEKEAHAAFVVDDAIAIAAVSLLIAGGAVFASSEAGQAAGRKIASTSSDIYNAIANRVNGVITLTAAAAIALKTFITYDLSQAISEPV